MYKTTPPADDVAALIAQGKAMLDRARSENRPLTDEENAQVQALIERAKAAKIRAKQQKGDAAVRDAIRTLSGDTSGPGWAVKGKTVSEWAKASAGVVTAINTSGGRKAVISGTYEVGSTILSGIERMPDYPTRLLDLLVNRKPMAEGNTFTFLRQSARTNNAAPVADGRTQAHLGLLVRRDRRPVPRRRTPVRSGPAAATGRHRRARRVPALRARGRAPAGRRGAGPLRGRHRREHDRPPRDLRCARPGVGHQPADEPEEGSNQP